MLCPPVTGRGASTCVSLLASTRCPCRWDAEPFLGDLVEQEGEQFIFGRGAIDDKHSVVGILLALEAVLRDHGQPQRTLYVAFGHDEEVYISCVCPNP